MPESPDRPADPRERALHNLAALEKPNETIGKLDPRAQLGEASELRIFVTKFFTISVVALIFVAVLVVVASGVWPDMFKEGQPDKIVDIIKTIALPVVTLILGYYFGAK